MTIFRASGFGLCNNAPASCEKLGLTHCMFPYVDDDAWTQLNGLWQFLPLCFVVEVI